MITPEPVENYCVSHSTPVNDIFTRLNAETRAFAPNAHHMQVGALEGGFFRMVVKASGISRILEFGTFTGCSSLHFALALPQEGRITTLDRDPRATAIAKRFWAEAGVEFKIESIVEDARISGARIAQEVEQGGRAPYDLAFIDADKGGYEEYMEFALRSVRPGGLILVDNVLWGGGVLDPREASDRVIHQFNEKYSRDPRLEQTMLPIRDGISWYRIQNL
jgi:caffeoyl-CoA O-methyltransferase